MKNMRYYNIHFVIDIDLTEDNKNKIIDKVKSIINREGEVTNIQRGGIRHFQIPINEKSAGYSVIIEFKAPVTASRIIDKEVRKFDDVIRHIIIWKGGEKQSFAYKERTKNIKKEISELEKLIIKFEDKISINSLIFDYIKCYDCTNNNNFYQDILNIWKDSNDKEAVQQMFFQFTGKEFYSFIDDCKRELKGENYD